MTYEEITTKLRAHECVKLSEISMTQLFMCMHDEIIKNVSLGGDVYELIFIPIEEPVGKVIYMDEQHYPTVSGVFDLLKEIVNSIKKNNSVTMLLEYELFELKVEVLETKE